MTRHSTKLRILRAFIRRGPSTVDEIECATGIPHQCASARATDLRRGGVLRATGTTRKTRLRGLRVYGMTVERRRVGNPSYGVWEYRVLSPVVAP